MTAPGWYPDPGGQPNNAYWDGQRWHRTAPTTTRRKPPAWKMIAGVIGSIVALLVGAAVWNQVKTAGPFNEAGLNHTVTDGQFGFRVTDVQTNAQMGRAPRGMWVVVTMTVANDGDRPQSFFAENQKLLDSDGREYSPDSMAMIALNQEPMVIDMNPGFSLKAMIPYDVPRGTEVERIELHDSMLSGGVTVKLR